MTTGQTLIALTVTFQVLNLVCFLNIWRHVKRIGDAAERAHPVPPIEYEDTGPEIKFHR